MDQFRYERRIARAKRKCRSELDIYQWSRWQYYRQSYWPNEQVDRVPRIDCARVSKQEFVRLYEQPSLPVVILGCTRDWPAASKWTPEVSHT
jgi:histone arginine demethylase JMJD6